MATITKENELDVFAIPLLKKPVLTKNEVLFFNEFYLEWVTIMVRIKTNWVMLM